MINHIYIKELLYADGSPIKVEAYTSLKDALKSEGLANLYRSCTYHIRKGEKFICPGDLCGISFQLIDAEIISNEVIFYQGKQINLKRSRHGKRN